MFNKLISKAKDKLIDMIKIEPFRQKEDAPALTAEQQFALNIGSILSEHRQAYCNALEMGESDLEEVTEGLEAAWEITDSASAKGTLDWLLTEGHRALYPYVLHGLKYDDDDELAEYVYSVTEDENFISDDEDVGAKMFHFVKQLKSAQQNLTDFDAVQFDGNFEVDITAWDAGRCVGVARMCYEVNYLSEAEAWEFIKKAAELSKPLYSSWKSFGYAYLIGRAMWSGPGMQLDNMMFDYKNHLEHANSPWLKYPWKK